VSSYLDIENWFRKPISEVVNGALIEPLRPKDQLNIDWIQEMPESTEGSQKVMSQEVAGTAVMSIREKSRSQTNSMVSTDKIILYGWQ